jgi:hypothetical protein
VKITNILAATIAIAISGCETVQTPSPTPVACSTTQTTHIKIHYGNSEIKVTPKGLNVKRNRNFEIRLHPDAGYEDKNVTVLGKTADSIWINGSGNVTGGTDKIVICVPDSTIIDEKYYYHVIVQDVGQLDPHVKVEN